MCDVIAERDQCSRLKYAMYYAVQEPVYPLQLLYLIYFHNKEVLNSISLCFFVTRFLR